MPEITIKDIAKRCGVGVSTVSRAMNNHPDINQETKNMVMEVIREVGFVPNNSARNLKRTDAKCIAVLVKGISNPLFGDMIQVIEEETQKKKYSLVLMHVEYDEDEVDVALELVKEKRLRGIVFLGGYFFHSQEKISNFDRALHIQHHRGSHSGKYEPCLVFQRFGGRQEGKLCDDFLSAGAGAQGYRYPFC